MPADEWAEEACTGVLPGDLVITEYLNDPEGSDTGQEYVELHNPHAKPVALESLTLYAARSDGSQEKGFAFTEPRSVLAGDYLVVGDVRDGLLPAHVDLSYGDALGSLGNASGKLGLRCGSRVIDEVPLSAPARSGLARALDGRLWPDSAGNDDLSRWCDVSGASGGSGTFQGSPGAANAPCAAGDGGVVGEGIATCVPLGAVSPRGVKGPRAGELVITEVMVNPLGDDTLGEWVEVMATVPVDLNGLSIGSDTTVAKLQAPQCLSLPAGGYAVLARRTEAVLNGGLPTPVASFGVDLRNSGGVVQVRAGEVLVDAMAYGASEEGVAAQVSPREASASGNDSPAAWCRAWEPYGPRGNRGTPGRVNRACEEGVDSWDGGSPGGGRDAGALEGGSRDGGADAGVPDGGARDGGGPDAGSVGASCIDRMTGRPRALRTPGVGSLVLTEFMADPAAVADGLGEWVEVLALRDVDLNGVSLMNESGASTMLDASLCLSMRAGSRGVLARNADTSLNGGLPSVLATFDFNLANAAGPRSLRLGVAGQVLDTVTWTHAATPGVSWQVAPASSDPWRNDMPGSFCLSPASARYGLGDRGTPGLENRACAP
nr:lamin tail domain-containing protein [Myxococcus stipitatus]